MSENKHKIKGNMWYFFWKRVFDIFFSFLAILILLLPMIIVGIIVKITSKGPMIFKDKRVGKNKKIINVYKFRSMYIDAEENIDKYLTPEQKEIWLRERKLDNDPRITKVGDFIRRHSIDELPQFLNILKGDMALIGPRPLVEKEVEVNYPDSKDLLLSLKPGLTGYWQAYARNNVGYENGQRQRMELYYIEHSNWGMDIRIIFQTAKVVINGDGAK